LSFLPTTVIEWRQLENLLAWIAVAVLLVTEPGATAPGTLRRRRVSAVLSGMLILSAIFAGAAQALLQSEMKGGTGSNAPKITGFLGDVLLALCGILVAFRELKRVLKRMGGKGGTPAGLTLLELWRFAAVQWGLLMVAAIMYLRVRVSPEDAAGSGEIRRLFFFLPAAGALPNAMMAGGLAAWDWLVVRHDLGRSRPRLRAWLLGLGAVNLGAGMLALRPAFLAIPGGIVFLLGVGLYLAGFPAEARRTLAGKIVLGAWLLVAIGCAAATLERILDYGNVTVPTFYGAAWRHLWGVGGVTLWLLGAGFWLVEREPSGKGLRRAAVLAAGIFVGGVVLTTGIFLFATTQASEHRLSVLRWLVLGTIPECVALLIAGAALVRGVRSRMS